jgi:periplasmic copper chaperone A
MRNVFKVLSPLMLLVSCGAAPKAARVDAAWVRLPAVAGNPGAAYFTLIGGPVADRLMAVSSPLAVRAEMHDMVMKRSPSSGSRGMMMSMAPLDAGVAVPAGGKVAFAPRGKHVMLFDISPKAQAGKVMPLKFSFASGATIMAQATLIAAGGDAPHDGH